MDRNAFLFHVFIYIFKKKVIFTKNNKDIFIKIKKKNDKRLDFKVLVFKRFFNQKSTLCFFFLHYYSTIEYYLIFHFHLKLSKKINTS